jgi:hypothetical protein
VALSARPEEGARSLGAVPGLRCSSRDRMRAARERSRLQTCHDLQVPVIPLRSARRHPYLSGTDGRSSLCGKGMDRCVKSPHSFCPVTPNTQRIGRRRSVVRKLANGCCSASEPVWRLPLCQTRRKVNRRQSVGVALRSLVGAREQLRSFRKRAPIFQDCDGVLRDFRRTSARSGSTLPNQTA